MLVPLASLAWLALLPGQAPDQSPKVDFAREIRPILANHCFACHGPDEKARKANLRLDRFDGATADLGGGDKALVPGSPAKSLLVHRLEEKDPAQVMPPPSFGKRPSLRELETLKKWINQGGEYSRHWAYLPPVRHVPPVVADSAWSRHPVDRFILDMLQKKGLARSPRADKALLFRRVSLDLTGLPPAPEETLEFLEDKGPDAYARAVDRLLSKPAFGERWASVWLDLARYGDSVGYTHDPPRNIWRWRDWLIGALNANKPFDQMTVEMLAGDLLPGATTDQLIASGFNRNTTTNTEGGSNAEEYHFAAVADRVNTTMQVWTGSTFVCAQCHSHKYDPISQKEYYQIFYFFNNTADFNSEDPSLQVPRVGQEQEFVRRKEGLEKARATLVDQEKKTDSRLKEWVAAMARDPDKIKSLPKEIQAILPIPEEKRSDPQKDALRNHHRTADPDWTRANDAVKKWTADLDQVAATTLVMRENPPRETFVALRGEFRNRGEKVAPGVPAEFPPMPGEFPANRLGFAKWLVAPNHPLTARVAVNRLWQEIFGTGLVETSEEFGAQGNPPSHPELLDWLATEYVRMGWDTKSFLKMLVTTEAYCQNSAGTPESFARDPQNRYLGRGPRFRLSAEAIRDQALAAAGLLSPRMYGPPAQPFQPTNGLAAAFGQSTDWETGKGEEAHRRAVYTRWRRNLPYPSMLTFDVPERAVCSVRRIRTNTPLQALVTLNDPVFFEAAQGLGRRMALTPGTPQQKAELGFRLLLVREPTPVETRRLVDLQAEARKRLAADPVRAEKLASKPIGPLPPGLPPEEAAAWTLVANTLLNLDETLMKP